MAKNTTENRYEALDEETKEEEQQETIPEMEKQKDPDPSDLAPQHQENEAQNEEPARSTERKDPVTISEGSITRSRAKVSSKETTNTSVEEQEPLSRKGRKSNKVIREQEAAREKVAGKQSNLDFLVKTTPASKYLLSPEEEKK